MAQHNFGQCGLVQIPKYTVFQDGMLDLHTEMPGTTHWIQWNTAKQTTTAMKNYLDAFKRTSTEITVFCVSSTPSDSRASSASLGIMPPSVFQACMTKSMFLMVFLLLHGHGSHAGLGGRCWFLGAGWFLCARRDPAARFSSSSF